MSEQRGKNTHQPPQTFLMSTKSLYGDYTVLSVFLNQTDQFEHRMPRLKVPPVKTKQAGAPNKPVAAADTRPRKLAVPAVAASTVNAAPVRSSVSGATALRHTAPPEAGERYARDAAAAAPAPVQSIGQTQATRQARSGNCSIQPSHRETRLRAEDQTDIQRDPAIHSLGRLETSKHPIGQVDGDVRRDVQDNIGPARKVGAATGAHRGAEHPRIPADFPTEISEKSLRRPGIEANWRHATSPHSNPAVQCQ